MRKNIATAVYGTLQKLRVFSKLAETEYRRKQLLILCYHGVSAYDEHLWRPDLYISPDKFRARLSSLKSAHANVLPLGEALTRLKSNSLPPRSVAITFDDGFVDFGSQAAPALLSYGYPATVYLTTHYSSYRYPVSNLMLDYLLWKSGQPRLAFPEFGIGDPVSIATAQQRILVSQQITRWAASQDLSTQARDEMLHRLAERLGIDYQRIRDQRLLQILSGDEISRLAAQGFDFELHTHRHRIPNTEASFEREIEDNRNRILEFTGARPKHFCYPSGRHTPEIVRWLARCGVVSAVTCDSGLARPESNPFLLPRVLDHHNLSTPRFQAFVAGFSF